MRRRKPLFEIIKMGWLFVCFAIGLAHFNAAQVAGADMAGFLGKMTIVTFPAGYLGVYLLKAIIWFFPAAGGDEVTRSYYFALTLWVLMTSLGYFQWFYLVPKILRKFKILKN